MRPLGQLFFNRRKQFFLCFKMTSSFSVAFDGVEHSVADGEEVLNAAAAHEFAQLSMVLRTLNAELSHVARDKNLGQFVFAQHIDGCTHRVRIGVVAVIDHHRTVFQLNHFPAMADRLKVL